MKAPILYSPMMGMGASLSVFAETPAVVIEDYFFESTTAYEITPLATGTVTDYHDTFDLDTNDYMPEALPDDEGYWDVMPELVTTIGGRWEQAGVFQMVKLYSLVVLLLIYKHLQIYWLLVKLTNLF